jgi:hypothetical protein
LAITRSVAIPGAKCASSRSVRARAMTSSRSAAMTRVGARLKLSAADTKALAFMPVFLTRLAASMPEIADALALVDDVETHGGPGALTTLYAPLARALVAAKRMDAQASAALASVVATEERYGSRRVAKPLIDGHRLMKELDLAAGPALGAATDALKRGFRNGTFATADEALQWLKAQRR